MRRWRNNPMCKLRKYAMVDREEWCEGDRHMGNRENGEILYVNFGSMGM